MAGERLTPEETRALVERHGSVSAAARAHGVPRSTFQYWLDPEPQRERMRARRADPEYRNRELDQQIERYSNLSGFAYTRRRHQIDMAARRRRIKRNEQRRRERGGDPAANAMEDVVKDVFGRLRPVAPAVGEG